MLRVALVGAGGMAGMHASCYGRINNADLVGVMDIRSEAAGALAGRYGAKPFTDFDSMLTGDAAGRGRCVLSYTMAC